MTLFGYRVPMMASLLVWCVLWEIVGRLDLIFLLPPFSDGARRRRSIWCRPRRGRTATVTTLRAFFIGMALADRRRRRARHADGAGEARRRPARHVGQHLFVSAPLSALVPVLMILFGFGEKTIVAAVFLFAVWIIVLDTRAGVRHISPSLIEMARSYGASPLALYSRSSSGRPCRRSSPASASA